MQEGGLRQASLKTQGFDTDRGLLFWGDFFCDNKDFKDFTVSQNESHKILLALTC